MVRHSRPSQLLDGAPVMSATRTDLLESIGAAVAKLQASRPDDGRTVASAAKAWEHWDACADLDSLQRIDSDLWSMVDAVEDEPS
jgi:hypothetical protein